MLGIPLECQEFLKSSSSAVSKLIYSSCFPFPFTAVYKVSICLNMVVSHLISNSVS